MSTQTDQRPNYQAPALDKGLDILECLSNSGHGLTQAQLARELGRQPTEIFRILTTLERRGYLHRDASSGAYRLTLRLFELGHTHNPFAELIRAADGPMRVLAERTGQACHLSVVHQDHLLVLHQVESSARVRVSVEIGSTYSLVRSASGRVLLAAMDDDERNLLKTRDPEFQVSTVEARSRLERRLSRIRQRGFEEAYSESIQGVTDLATLVGVTGGRVNAALAIAALPRERASFIQETVEPLRACANEIGLAAGLKSQKEV